MRPEYQPKMPVVRRIADAIADYVERTGGPVTLAEIADGIPGFSVDRGADSAWCWETEDVLIWDGMTKEGCAALRHVVMTRRVTIQQSSRLLYFFHGRYLSAPNWGPIALAPAAKANFRTPTILLSAPEKTLKQLEDAAAKRGLHGWQRTNHES
jgi:hypothetical protein